ncbi:MAG: hypothetical protein ABI606_20835, partial [Rhodoferax sp.]
TLGRSDIYLSRWRDGKWRAPENLGAGVNSAAQEVDSYIAPDQSFVVLAEGATGMTLTAAREATSAPDGRRLRVRSRGGSCILCQSIIRFEALIRVGDL